MTEKRSKGKHHKFYDVEDAIKAKESDYRIYQMIKIADYFSLGNAVFGFLSIIMTMLALFYHAESFLFYSAIFMIVAVFFDFIDGKVARFTKTFSKIGKDLDSLSDVVSFGVAPALFGFAIVALSTDRPLLILIQAVISTFFVVCGILRLARFNVINIKGYIGVPITLSGLLVPLIYVLGNMITIPLYIWPAFFVIYAIFMVSSIRINKMF